MVRGEGEGGIGVDVGRGDGASVADGVAVANGVDVIGVRSVFSGVDVGAPFPLQPASRATTTATGMLTALLMNNLSWSWCYQLPAYPIIPITPLVKRDYHETFGQVVNIIRS